MPTSTVERHSKLSLTTFKTLHKVLGIMSLVGWVLFTTALYMFHYATPGVEIIYDTMRASQLANQPPAHGGGQYGYLFLVFLTIGIGVTLAALVLNVVLYRARRTHIWLNLLLLMVSCASILIYFLLVF